MSVTSLFSTRRSGLVLSILALGVTLLGAPVSAAGVATVKVATDDQGQRLTVNGESFMVLGMNWDYFPIGTNYSYSLWTQSDDIITEALAREMPLLQAMGVNAVRLYNGIPPRWVTYIHDTYGIWTILNHPVARWGYTIDGVWVANTDYANPRLREAVKDEIFALVEEFKDTRGVLMWLLGNENNYGLSWTSFEIEALPEGEQNAARARALYSLYEEITQGIHARDANRPVAICNGDVQYIDIIAEECKSLDVFATNVYRGISVRDMYEVVSSKMGIPLMQAEFGSDAFNAREMREDQTTQARYLVGQWQEIYEQSWGKGRVGNSIGGCTFQWSDGWWKFRQEENLDIHDTNASWPNGGYAEDFVPGENNMNEEWWGICAKGFPDSRGLYDLYPRAAFYALQEAYKLDPYGQDTDLATIRAHFGKINVTEEALTARGNEANRVAEALSKVRVSGLRMEFETFSTGGIRTTTPEEGGATAYPSFQGFDQLQSFYADITAQPSPNVTGRLSLNVLGQVPTNPIDEVFYENRGRSRTFQTTDQGAVEVNDLERVKVYGAEFAWQDRWFELNGFYRTGHYHWGYEGDFFGLYREAFYGENLDIYNGIAPVGVEIHGKKRFEGLTVAFGPQLWWGANPAIMGRYTRQFGKITATGVFQEDIADQVSFGGANIPPIVPNRKATLHLATRRGNFGIEVGGIWAGSTKLDEAFDIYKENDDGTHVVLRDSIRVKDTLGAKARLTWQKGRWNWYGETAYMGLVADGGGPAQTQNYTGWNLKDTGSGNQSNIITGLAVNMGNYQIAPNMIYQKPLVGPMPNRPLEGLRARRVGLGSDLDDPFAVRSNREMMGTELVFTYDPTPASWFWAWDNYRREDAGLAFSVGLAYRDYKTTQDAATAYLEDGETRFAFPGAAPARNLWEMNARIVSRLGYRSRLVANLFAGKGEATGGSASESPDGPLNRAIDRFGGDARLIVGSVAFETFAKFNDWGPYDYHRDFNLTFPLQLMGDLSYSLGNPSWFDTPATRFGVRGLWRSLDEFSPRYCPDPPACDPLAPAGEDGNEWEIRTYLHVAI